MSSGRFLGLDCGTQSLAAVIVDFEVGERVWEDTVLFDRDLPQYGTRTAHSPAATPGWFTRHP